MFAQILHIYQELNGGHAFSCKKSYYKIIDVEKRKQ